MNEKEKLREVTPATKKRMEEIGLRIKEIRTEKKFTQEKFAAELNSHQNDITNIERGIIYPSRNILMKIARKFPDVSMDYIFRGTKDKDSLQIDQNIQDLITLKNIIENEDEITFQYVNKAIQEMIWLMVKQLNYQYKHRGPRERHLFEDNEKDIIAAIARRLDINIL